MIATHNIKVDGRWIHAGEEYNVKAEKGEKAEKVVEPVAAPVEPEEQPKTAETKPKTATRRKGTK